MGHRVSESLKKKKTQLCSYPIPPVSPAEQSSGVTCLVPLFSSLQQAPLRLPTALLFTLRECKGDFFYFLEDLFFFPDDKKSPQIIYNTLSLSVFYEIQGTLTET